MYLMLTLVCQYVYGKDSTLVVFWNLENFFDYTDGGEGESDKEWSSLGSRRWTKTRFYTKCDAIAKTMFWIGEKYGRMPDVIGVAEVENSGVLYKLLSSTLLRKCDYKVVHYDSRDRRGIDVALLYRSSVFRKVSSSVTVPEYDGEKLLTRDILQVCLETAGGERVNVLVNHHPSKYGGSQASESRRDAAMTVMRNLCDSLAVADSGVPVIAMGDFNDTPESPSLRPLTEAQGLHCISQELGGSYRYKGQWEQIDHIYLTPTLLPCADSTTLHLAPEGAYIYSPTFLTEPEPLYGGRRPHRTYNGMRYQGGTSDHLPIVFDLTFSYE